MVSLNVCERCPHFKVVHWGDGTWEIYECDIAEAELSFKKGYGEWVRVDRIGCTRPEHLGGLSMFDNFKKPEVCPYTLEHLLCEGNQTNH
jgi:hypothetical protein